MRRLLVTLLILLPVMVFSQQHLRKNRDVFPTQGNLERKGWIFSPAITYMAPPLKQANQRLSLGSDTIYDIAYRAAGKIGIGIEVGRFYAIDASRLISYVDFAVGYKSLRGTETFRAVLDDPDRSTPFFYDGEGVFTEQYLTASFNATNIRQFSDHTFMTNAIGINADYKLGENVFYNRRGLPIDQMMAPDLLSQVHYRLGFGFRVSPKFLIIPSVETPILTLYAFDQMKSTMAIFNSRYRPVIVRLNIMMFDNKSKRKCPPKGPGKRKSTETLFGMTDSNRPW